MRNAVVVLIVALLSVMTVGACAKPADERKVRVVASFYPLEFFVSRVGGDRVLVTNPVGPGVEPHDFEPTATDMKAIAAAHVLVYNGLGFEPWVDRALASIGRSDLIVVAAAEAVGVGARRAGESGGDSVDPHVWLDPRLAIRQVEAIRDALKKANPAGANDYDRNAELLVADLTALDLRYTTTLAACRLDHFVAAHEAFGYLASRYGLKQIAIAGIEQEEPNAAQLARIVDAARINNVKVVLIEPGASPKIAETLAKEVGAQVMELDPIEFATEGDYIGSMDRNRLVLRKALECDDR